MVISVVAFGVVSALSDGQEPATSAEAAAFVSAVLLKPSDLPGSGPFVGESGSPPEGAELRRELQRLLHCGHRGTPRGRTLGAGRSVLADPYRDGIGEAVASVVIVMPSEALAKAEIATLRTRSGRACVARDIRAFTLPSSPVYGVSIISVPVAHLLGNEAVALHLTARLQRSQWTRSGRGPRRSAPSAKLFYSVEAIFRIGAADIAFYTLSEHRRFPAATESRLLTLLHDRARAHEFGR